MHAQRTTMAICLVIAAGFCAAAASAPAPKPADSTLTLTGTLQTGVMAIGGETTGIQINSGNVTYELDIKDAELKKKAEELNGKSVTIKGTLTIKQGVERGQRRIIAVESLVAATAKP